MRSFSKEVYPLNEFYFDNGDGKNLIFIHDMFTHDQAGLYSRGKFEYTSEEYQSLVHAHFSQILPKTLTNLKFDPKCDDLILFSDHGMTIGKLDKFRVADEWCLPSLDFKARTFCRCYFSSDMVSQVFSEPLRWLHYINLSKNGTSIWWITLPTHFRERFHLGNNAFGTWSQNKLNQFYLFEQIDYDQYVKHIVQINPFRIGRTKITRGQEGELEKFLLIIRTSLILWPRYISSDSLRSTSVDC